VADQVTPDKTPEEIKSDMEQTRESLTDKVSALETQVVGTVQTAADTITNTVEAVKSFVTNAPEAMSDTVKHAAAAVSETVKNTFDITGRVQRNPWAAVGTTALIGGVIGWLTSRSRSTGAPPSPDYAPASTGSARGPAAAPEPPRRVADEAPGVVDELFGMLSNNLKDLARTALETVSRAVKEQVQTGVPKLVEDAATRLTDRPGTDEPPFAARFDERRTRM
jgi:ElaB/YqjD/DUF883 family membrane-anchored ribosome-binding protein